MRTKWAVAAAAIGVCGAALAPAGSPARETAQETISRLQSQGYTVTIDKIGTGADRQVHGHQRPQPADRSRSWCPTSAPAATATAAPGPAGDQSDDLGVAGLLRADTRPCRHRSEGPGSERDPTGLLRHGAPYAGAGTSPAQALRRVSRGRRPSSTRRTDRRRSAPRRPARGRWSWSTNRPAASRRRCRRSWSPPAPRT